MNISRRRLEELFRKGLKSKAFWILVALVLCDVFFPGSLAFVLILAMVYPRVLRQGRDVLNEYADLVEGKDL